MKKGRLLLYSFTGARFITLVTAVSRTWGGVCVIDQTALTCNSANYVTGFLKGGAQKDFEKLEYLFKPKSIYVRGLEAYYLL